MKTLVAAAAVALLLAPPLAAERLSPGSSARITPTSEYSEAFPVLNADGSKLVYRQGTPFFEGLSSGFFVQYDLRAGCSGEVIAPVQFIDQSNTILNGFDAYQDGRAGVSFDPEKLAWWNRTDSPSGTYQVFVSGMTYNSGYYDVTVSPLGPGNAFNSPRPHLSADGSTLWTYARGPFGTPGSFVANVGSPGCSLSSFHPAATLHGISSDGSEIAGVYSTATALEIRRMTRGGSDWCSGSPSSTTIAVSNPMYDHWDSDLYDANGIYDVTMSQDGERIAWTSAVDHCSTSTPKPALGTRDIWVWFEDSGDVPSWMDVCATNANLARVEMEATPDRHDTRAAVSPKGTHVLFISTGDYVQPTTIPGVQSLLSVNLDSSLPSRVDALDAIAVPPLGERIIWGSFSGDGRVAAWQSAVPHATNGTLTASDIDLANLFTPDATPEGDSPALLPDEPIDAVVTECLSARGVVNVGVRVTQFAGGPRRLLILGSVTNGTITREFGPVVQRISDVQFADVALQLPDMSGSLSCSVRVVDPGQMQPDLVDVEAP